MRNKELLAGSITKGQLVMSDVSNPIQNETVAADARAGVTVIKNQAARIPHRCQANAYLAGNSDRFVGRLALSMAVMPPGASET
jgi:hypothetical protein